MCIVQYVLSFATLHGSLSLYSLSICSQFNDRTSQTLEKSEQKRGGRRQQEQEQQPREQKSRKSFGLSQNRKFLQSFFLRLPPSHIAWRRTKAKGELLRKVGKR